MTEDKSVPGDGIDDVVEELRRCNPVDIEALPSSRSTKATAALEQILDSGDEPDITEPESEPHESSPSPAADNPVGEKGRRRVQRRGDS